ncbi:hypothetical protein M0811_12141 [Anaeramoeba ignava]|uniref:Uncharacterized protein n=1 Tax=Anaeramoeba ignava TaxID=1746090 RepID=A0A9Q0LBD7_ANAIG|nr:hypothetical protein M0811_12141 [Anaeramoeba ignava]
MTNKNINTNFLPSLNPLISNPLFFLIGGSSSVSADLIVRYKLNSKPTTFTQKKSLFIRAGLNDVLVENLKRYWSKKLNLKPEERWKLGFISGFCIGVSKSIATVLYRNCCENWKKKTEKENNQNNQNDPKDSILSNSLISPPINLISSPKKSSQIFQDFQNLFIHEGIYATFYHGFREFNYYWIVKYLLPNQMHWFSQISTAILLGGITSAQASFASRPFSVILNNFVNKKKTTYQEIESKTIKQAKYRVPRSSIKLCFYRQSKQLIIPTLAKMLPK